MSSEDEGRFLSRWSQRKREAIKQADKQGEPPVTPADLPAEPEEEDFDLSLLPSLEELTPATDLTLFFKKGVPEVLRNAALRKMWTLDPAIRDYRSEALDYAYDWNAPGGVPGGGDLPEGFDSSEMVARIFGDPPADKNVIEDGAVQQAKISNAQNGLPEQEPQSAKVEIDEKVEDFQSQFRPVAELKPDDAPHSGRRHGGALPSVSSKSIMS